MIGYESLKPVNSKVREQYNILLWSNGSLRHARTRIQKYVSRYISIRSIIPQQINEDLKKIENETP